MDLSESWTTLRRNDENRLRPGWAAALAYMMIHQQDPVGLIPFDEKKKN